MTNTNATLRRKHQFALFCFFLGWCLVTALNGMPAFALGIENHTLHKVASHTKWSNPTQPGLFKIDQSADDSICRPIAKIINDDINRYGQTFFEEHEQFIKWQMVDEANIDRGENKFDGDVEQAQVDINNDGIDDRVFRTKWSIRGALSDRLDAFPIDQKFISLEKLTTSDKKIDFNSASSSINSYVKKNAHQKYDWHFDGVSSIHLFKNNEKTYVLAQNYAAPDTVSAKIYVFQLNETYEPLNKCMLVKICPCGGCTDSPDAGKLSAKKNGVTHNLKGKQCL